MPPDVLVKALLVAMTDPMSGAVASINRLKPERLCFFLPEAAKATVEQRVQPHVVQMPQRWDWIVTPDPSRVQTCLQALGRTLPDMMRAWEIHEGELVVDIAGATPAMATAVALVAARYCSRLIEIAEAAADAREADTVVIEGRPKAWVQSNPWDDLAGQLLREGCELFNRGAHVAAGSVFRQAERRVSGGQKPLHRAFADLADGYAAWERFQYRPAWEKIKAAQKALEMAAVWGGPPGLKDVLAGVKPNAGFLERLVLDPSDVKEYLVYDLFAHARRQAAVHHDQEAALAVLVRALEAFAQWRLFKHHRIKSWDVRPEQLPAALQESCRMCFVDDVDGKHKLPLLAQFRALAGLGDPVGQAYLAHWLKLKPLLDVAAHAVLGHGFEPVKPERVDQLYDVVIKITGVSEASLPKFPTL